MQEITAEKSKLLNRYLKLTTQLDKAKVSKLSKQASIRLLEQVEKEYLLRAPTENTLLYLQGVNRRKARKYKGLRKLDSVIEFLDLLRSKTYVSLMAEPEADGQ